MGKDVSHDQLRGITLLVAPTYGNIWWHGVANHGRKPNGDRVRETISFQKRGMSHFR